MKTFKKLSLISLIALSFTSCKKSITEQSVENTIEIFSNREEFNFIKVDTVVEKNVNDDVCVFVVSKTEFIIDGLRKPMYTVTQSYDINSRIAKNNLKKSSIQDKEQSKRTGVYTVYTASGDKNTVYRASGIILK